MNWLIARLKEPSTWRGIVWLLTFAGLSLKPEQSEAIIAAGIALAGVLGVFLKEPTHALPPIELQGRSQSDPIQQAAVAAVSSADRASFRRDRDPDDGMQPTLPTDRRNRDGWDG